MRAAKDFQNVSILRNTNCKMHLSGLGVMAQRPRCAGWPAGGLTWTIDSMNNRSSTVVVRTILVTGNGLRDFYSLD